jgi:hypothetical protein
MGTPIFLDSGAKRDCPCETRKSHIHTLFTTAKAATMIKVRVGTLASTLACSLQVEEPDLLDPGESEPRSTRAKPAAACGSLSKKTGALSTAPAGQAFEQIDILGICCLFQVARPKKAARRR